MLSRVADSLYWMARYVERAENLARLLLSTRHLLLDAGAEEIEASQIWQPILTATGDEEAYFAQFPNLNGRHVADFLALSEGHPNSIRNSLRAARENARTIRDQISDEMWECLNELRLFIDSRSASEMHGSQSASFYEVVLRGSYQFQGIAHSTTPRGENWQFLRLGTCLERADKVSRLIDSCSCWPTEMPTHPDARPLPWAALLRSCSAWHAFQSINSRLDPVRIVEYLLLNETFPRSVACCIVEVQTALNELCGQAALDDMPKPMRLAGRLRSDLQYAMIHEILANGLHEYLDVLQTRCNAIGEAIFEKFVLYADLQPTAPVKSRRDVGAYHLPGPGDWEAEQQQQQQQQ